MGGRVRVWRGLGARVVAVEPQPDCLRVLRLFFGRDRGVALVPGAAGAEPGRARLALSTATPTVSSMSPGWIKAVTTDRGFARVRWDRSVGVEVTTLDELIAVHGVPAFCKIDVEGFEADVLAGLSRPLRPCRSSTCRPRTTPPWRRWTSWTGWATTPTTTPPSRPCGWPAPAGSTRPNCGGGWRGSGRAGGRETSTPASANPADSVDAGKDIRLDNKTY
ncbi:FkbM family methyltransferase [Actinomadura luteofluorescens]|uniref:FkbM family methyltransferase n=1 Tax=Actinomadura luteofluorescens TaxID=46163 RepID=UPI0036399F8C